MRDVLHDHVHIDVRRSEWIKDGLGNAGTVRDGDHRHLRNLCISGQPAHLISLLHVHILLDLGSGLIHKGTEYLDRDAVHPAQLYGARLHHLRPLVGELQHLLIADHLQLAGIRNHAGIRRVNARHVREDLAALRPEGCRQGHGRGVRTAATERGGLRAADPLEAGHDHHPPRTDLFAHPLRFNGGDAPLAEGAIGADPRLRAAEAHRLHAAGAERHREQRRRLDLASGQECVLFARIGERAPRHLRGECEQIIGGVAHGGNHGDDAVPCGAVGRNACCNGADARDIRNGAAAVLLNEERVTHAPKPSYASMRTPSVSTSKRSAPPPICAVVIAASIAAATALTRDALSTIANTDEPAPARDALTAPASTAAAISAGMARYFAARYG